MKPTFVQSKGEANKTADAIDTAKIVEHYRNICRGLFEWDGLPEDMPRGYIEDTCLFFCSGVSMKEVSGIGLSVLPANPVTMTIYGTPYEWLPAYIQNITAYRNTDYLDLFEKSNTPVLWMGNSRFEIIKPYIELMSKAMKVLGVNITALSQPVLIAGRPSGNAGDNINAILLKNDISSGESYIPVVEPGAIKMEVLDLKATDNTQNLLSTIKACDTFILELLGANTGVEKSSGITPMETAVSMKSIEMDIDAQLKRRQDWCDKINAILGTNVTVRRGDYNLMFDGTEDTESNDKEDNNDAEE